MIAQFYRHFGFLALAAGSVIVLTAAPASIGFIRSNGDFRLDGSTVRGNSTVFSGNVIETAAARSVVQVGSSQITISPESRAKLFGDHTVLMKGEGLLRDSGGHILEADFLRISAASNDALVQVDIQTPSHISVAARNGVAHVRNASGILLADVRPGMALAFENQTGGSTAVKMTGTVTVKDGKYYLTDTTTNVTVELRGNDLAKQVGKKVQIVGSVIPGAAAAAGASEVVQVTGVTALVAGAAAAGAGAGAGLSATTVGAIVAGVAVAGTVGGLAAAGSFSGASSTSGQ